MKIYIANLAGMDDITCDDLTYDLNADVHENVVLGLMIYCLMI